MASTRWQKGFTLLELLLAATIGVVVLGGAYMVYDASQSTARKDERMVDLQQNARNAMDLLMWQIRLAGYLNLGKMSNRIAIGTGNLLVVRGDVQLTGGAVATDTLFTVQQPGLGLVCNTTPPCPNCPPPPCLVTGTSVYTVNAAQTVTAFNVSSVTFQYYDQNNSLLTPTPLDGVTPVDAATPPAGFANGTAAANPLPGTTTNRDAVRKVRITLTAIDPNLSAGPGIGSAQAQVTLTADVRLREPD